MVEIWKEIKGWEGKYEISNLGRCRTLEHLINRKDGTSQMAKSRIKKPHINEKGYLSYNLGSTKRYYAHRLVAEAFIPNPNNLPEVDHIDTNRANNSITNLRWVTRQQNINNKLSIVKRKEAYKKLKIPIVELDQFGKYKRTWDSAADIIKEKNYTSIYINKKNKKLKSTGGCIYLYEKDYSPLTDYTLTYNIHIRFQEKSLNKHSVIEFDNKDNIINVFTSTSDASKHFGITQGSILLRCKNRAKGITMRRPPKLMYYKDLNKLQKSVAKSIFLATINPQKP